MHSNFSIQSEKQANPWLKSAYAQQLLSCEAGFLKNALRQISGPRVLQLGHRVQRKVIEAVDFPQLLVSNFDLDSVDKYSVAADSAFLPFAPNVFASVILPHALQGHPLPHQVLREAHRVLSDEGHIVLTSLNPFSLLGLQKLCYPKALPKGQLYSLRRVKDWLQLLGFEVIGSAMYQYAPLSKKASLRRSLDFLNSVGDRWLPMAGGSYMIVAKKRHHLLTLVGRGDVGRQTVSIGRRAKSGIFAGAAQSAQINLDINNPANVAGKAENKNG